jgi:hypothetical protein
MKKILMVLSLCGVMGLSASNVATEAPLLGTIMFDVITEPNTLIALGALAGKTCTDPNKDNIDKVKNAVLGACTAGAILGTVSALSPDDSVPAKVLISTAIGIVVWKKCLNIA